MRPYLALAAAGYLLLTAVCHAQWSVGVAKVDITPMHPVRLSGYGGRTREHEGVFRAIHARALALRWGRDEPCILIAVDNCGIPEALRLAVVEGLRAQNINPMRLANSCSHTHCAPMVTGVLENLFGADLPPDQAQRVQQYTDFLIAKLVQVIEQALGGMQEAKIEHSIGVCRFAMNRRRPAGAAGMANAPNPTGPVDHQLPLLKITHADGSLMATVQSYVCPCTTVGMNFIHSDWAGCASDEVEQRFPGCVSLAMIGCGADQNPNPRRQDELPLVHGMAMAAEITRLLAEPMRSISGPLRADVHRLKLEFAPLPTEADWHQRSLRGSPALMRHARRMPAQRQTEEGIPTQLPYQVMAWRFGKYLDMVFLNGEVVVDYALRLPRDFVSEKL